MRIAPVALVALLLAPAALAGCIGQEGGLEQTVEIVDGDADPDEVRGEDEYWMVWIRGNETDERANQAVCDRLGPDYRLEPTNRSVVYDNRSYTFDPEEVHVLLAFEHEDRSSSCPEALGLVADPEPEHVEEMGEWGELTLTVREDGILVADGREIGLGEAGAFSYAGTPEDPDKLNVDGHFRAEVLGAWPQEKLQAGQP